MYMRELEYKEDYYHEVEESNQYVIKLRHDLKNKLNALYDLATIGESETILKELNQISREIELAENCIFSENPAVNSVVKIKAGKASINGIEIDAQIQIPKKMCLAYGDIGVLYGNLLDNAIEACIRSEAKKPFIHIKSKYQGGNLFLLIRNSKNLGKNESLITTKVNKRYHGNGILSVRKVVEKYNGTVTFDDHGEVFEAFAILYHVQIPE